MPPRNDLPSFLFDISSSSKAHKKKVLYSFNYKTITNERKKWTIKQQEELNESVTLLCWNENPWIRIKKFSKKIFFPCFRGRFLSTRKKVGMKYSLHSIAHLMISNQTNVEMEFNFKGVISDGNDWSKKMVEGDCNVYFWVRFLGQMEIFIILKINASFLCRTT